ncbi:MAG: peroxiredoxin [Bacteroidota bacterium]
MLDKGDKIPDITLEDQNSQSISLRSYIGKNVVVYFYPKDFTPGCTKEACSFRDNYSLLEKYGAAVVGISADSPASHKKFAKAYNLEYTLLSDTHKKAEKAFGVKRNMFGLLPGRETFIFNQQGKLIGKFTSAIAATRHVEEAIKVLKKNQ